jgi:DNA invertase Pin-like site-specific DNA recombinase
LGGRILVGYARVSTQEQDLALQLDALQAALGYTRPGDTLVVWKLDRLARSLKQLLETVEDPGARGVCLCSLTEVIDTPPPAAS